MPTIDIYATGQTLTFLPSERAERIVLEAPSWWWNYRIDFVRDQAVRLDRDAQSLRSIDPHHVLNICRQVAGEQPGKRWTRKEDAGAAQSQS